MSLPRKTLTTLSNPDGNSLTIEYLFLLHFYSPPLRHQWNFISFNYVFEANLVTTISTFNTNN